MNGHALVFNGPVPGEIAGPADKLKRLQKTATMRFVKEAQEQEQMDVKEWAQDELGKMARKAYKTAQPAINTAIDERLLASFERSWMYGTFDTYPE
jgi:hypothetical protein